MPKTGLSGTIDKERTTNSATRTLTKAKDSEHDKPCSDVWLTQLSRCCVSVNTRHSVCRAWATTQCGSGTGCAVCGDVGRRPSSMTTVYASSRPKIVRHRPKLRPPPLVGRVSHLNWLYCYTGTTPRDYVTKNGNNSGYHSQFWERGLVGRHGFGGDKRIWDLEEVVLSKAIHPMLYLFTCTVHATHLY